MRTQVATAAGSSQPAWRGLGYRFDPAPAFTAGLVAAGKLTPLDDQVLRHLLRFRRLPFSCWTAKATIADRIGRCPRTVQRSFDRLSRAGVIEQRPVASPDPEDSANRTGWRIVFLWLAPEGYQPGPGPNRAGKGAGQADRGDKNVSPLEVSPETLLSPPPETPVSPNTACGSDSGLDRGSQTDEDGSSSLVTPGREADPPREEARAVAEAVAAYGPPTETRARAAVAEFGPAWVSQAVGLAKKAEGKPWGFVLGILRNWQREGGPLAPPVKIAPHVVRTVKPVVPPPEPDTPEGIETMLEWARSGDRIKARLGRAQLARAGALGLLDGPTSGPCSQS